MTPGQFLHHLKKQGPAPVYLSLGPEAYRREVCRRALIDATLTPEEREQGFVHRDLDDAQLSEVMDDARSLSLFATRRLSWISSAESALPKGRAAAAESDDDGAPAKG